MNGLTIGHAVALGILQGLTEFLPISSSGHLALAQRLLGLDPNSPSLLLFDAMAHVGTLAAIFIVFAKPGLLFLRRLRNECNPSFAGRRFAGRLVVMAVIATIPTAVIGLSFKNTFKSAFDRPAWIGAGLIITGFALLAMLWRRHRLHGWAEMRWWHAALIGTAQGCAIMPGISRSGTTIASSALTGLRRRWCAQFSFLIATPAIIGAALIELRDCLDLPTAAWQRLAWVPIFLGAAVSFVVGVAALKILLNLVRRAKLHYFALYCWILGAVVLIAAN